MQTKGLVVVAAFVNSILDLCGKRVLALLSIFVFSVSALAMNGRTTYQAKIIKPDGYPLESANVNFRFTVLDTIGSCVLYVEDYSAVNMSGGGGLISFALGNGNRSFPVSGTSLTFQNTFDNSVPMFNCQTPGTYNPGPNDVRKVVMQFNDGGGWQTLPAMTINTVPYAMYAHKANDSKTLNGKADTAFVENATLAALNCNPVTQAITFNGVSFSCVAVGSGGSGVSSVTTSGTVLSVGGTASAPVISITAATMSQDGYLTSLDYAEFKAKLSVSSTQIINTLGYAPVSGAAVAAQINNSNLSGDVSGTVSANSVISVGGKSASQISTSVDATLAATASATADALVKRNSAGSATFNDVYASAAKINYVDIYKPSTSFNIRLQAPTSLSTNYVLNLPTTSGTTGQVLSTDGSGNLSWISPTTGSVVSVSATAPLASSGGSNPTISITQASSGASGYLSSTDWNTFNNKQAATSAAIITTLGYTPADSAASGTYAQKANNLSDLTSIATARTNLGLGTLATANSIDLGGASATGIIADARLVTQANVISGTQYTKVTVDGKGRVTSGAQLNAGDVTTALGYTPANSATIISSQWATSGTKIYYNSGNVGIGTTTPVTKLEVSGGLRIGIESAACAPSYAGTLRYNAGVVEYCNGTSWVAFGVSGAGIVAINGLASGSQTFAFGSSGTTPNVASVGSVHTFNFPYASVGATTAGVISNADYVSFANKITSSAAAISQVLGYVPASATALGNYLVKANNLSDLTSSASARTNLGLGGFATVSSLDLGSASATGTLADARLPSFANVTSGTQYTKVTVDGKGRVTSGGQLSVTDVTTALGYTPASASASTQWVTSGSAISYSAGNVGVGTTTPQKTFDVSGTLRVSGSGARMDISTDAIGVDQLTYFDGSDDNDDVHFVFRTTLSSGPGAGIRTGLDLHRIGNTSEHRLGVNKASPLATLDVSGSAIFSGSVGIGITNPSARLTLASGTSTVAAFKFTSGTLLSAAQAGAMEYDGASYYLTDAAGNRRMIATAASSGSLDNASIIYSSGNMNLVPVGSVIVSSTTASTNSQTGALIVNGGLGVAGNIYSSGTIITSSNIQGASITATNGMITPYIYGSTVSGGSLSLESTTHANKGNIALAVGGGNVGIGTTAPGHSLSVKGTIGISRISPAVADLGTVSYADQTSGLKIANTSAVDPITIFTNGIERLHLTAAGKFSSSGYFGIGTTNPQAPLDISSGDNNGTMLLGADSNATTRTDATTKIARLNVAHYTNAQTPFSFAFMRSTSTANEVNIGGGTSLANASTLVAFHTAANSTTATGSERMRIDSSGNVGIGTSTPSALLHPHINASTYNQSILRAQQGGSFAAMNDYVVNFQTYGNRSALGNGTQHGLYVQAGWDTDINDTEIARFSSLNGGYSDVPRVVIKSNGKIGIGTTSPTMSLDIQGGSSVNGSNGMRILSTNSSGNNNALIEAIGKRSDANVYGTFAGTLALGKNRTDAATAASGSALGRIMFGGNHTDGNLSNLLYTTSIQGVAEGAFSDANTMPSGIAFYTGSTGYTTSQTANHIGTERLRISSSGNVGIGTSTPTKFLHLQKDQNTDTAILLKNASSGTTGMAAINVEGDINGVQLITYSSGVTGNWGSSTIPKSNSVMLRTYTTLPVSHMGIGTGSAAPLHLVTSDIPRLTVNSTGNIGIGTSSPTARLHLVSGTASLAPLKLTSGVLLSSAQPGSVEYDGTDFYITDGNSIRRTIATATSAGTLDNISIVSSPAGIALWPASGNSVTVSATTVSTNSSTGALIVNGGLGVGGALNVAGIISGSATIKATGYRANQGAPDAADSSTVGYAFGSDGDTGIFSPGTGSANGVLAFYSNNAERMRLTASGSFGVGTTNPSGKFSVGGGEAAGESRMTFQASDNSNRFTIETDLDGSTGNDLLGFRSVISDNILVLKGNGYVGIGTASATTNLEVSSTAASPVRITSTNTSATGLLLANSKVWSINSAGSAASLAPDGSFLIRNATDNLNALTISSAGNVGIGATNPFDTLEVSGTLSVAAGANNRVVLADNRTTTVNASSPKLSFFGATDDAINQIQGPSIQKIHETSFGRGRLAFFQHGGSDYTSENEVMSIAYNGNLGVGTTAPAALAHFNKSTTMGSVGTLNVSNAIVRIQEAVGTSLNFDGNTVLAEGEIFMGTESANNIQLFTSETTRLTILGTGNIGIGTTAPVTKLDITDSTAVSSTLGTIRDISAIFGNAGTGSSRLLTRQVRTESGGTTHESSRFMIQRKVDTSDMGFVAFNGGGTDAGGTANRGISLGVGTTDYFTMIQNGNIGIGTTNPQEKIHVEATTGGRLQVGTGNIFSATGFGTSLESDTDDGVIYLNAHTKSSGANVAAIAFRGGHGSAESATSRTIITFKTDSGNVGIGTTAPASSLHVSGSVRVYGNIYGGGNSAGTPSGETNGMWVYGPNYANFGMFYTEGSPDKISISPNGNGTSFPVMVISGNGSVGVGTSAPTYTMDVSGTLRVAGQAYTNSGNGSFTVLSDVRYKDVHGKFDRGLAEILNINIIKFNYKKDNPLGSDSSREYVGVSAQNLQQVLPEAVELRKDGEKEYLTINSSPVLWTLINAVKQLYKRLIGVEDQMNRQIATINESKADKAEIKVLKAKSDKLEAENAALKAYLCSKDPAAPICN